MTFFGSMIRLVIEVTPKEVFRMSLNEPLTDCKKDLSFLGVPYDPDCYPEASDTLDECEDECCYIDECCC